MINRLSNPINRNRSAAKISKVMSSSMYEWLGYCQLPARLVSNLLKDQQAPPSSLSLFDHHHRDYEFNDDDGDIYIMIYIL